jgi:hypothetical protein
MMLSKRMLLLVCAQFVLATSNAFGVVVVKNLSPKFVAEHKDEFRVATKMRGDAVEFTVTRYVKGARYCSAEIVVRKGGRLVVRCHLLPSGNESRLSYTFTLSPEYTIESDFLLWEGRLGDLTLIGPDNTRVTSGQRDFADVCFRISLKDFVNGMDDSR